MPVCPQGSNLLDTKSSRSSSTNSSSRRLLRSTTVGRYYTIWPLYRRLSIPSLGPYLPSTTVGSTSSGGSHTVMINGSPQFLPVIDWNELVIDDHNPLLGKVGLRPSVGLMKRTHLSGPEAFQPRIQPAP